MTARLNHVGLLEDPISHLVRIEAWLAKSSLDHTLLALVKLRASQLNGCGYCLHMHTGEALRGGEAVERIALVGAWGETTLFSPAEQAALAWTDAVTRLGPGGAEDSLYTALLEHFSPPQIASLTLAIGMINLWNRLAVSFRAEHPRRPLTRVTEASRPEAEPS